MPMLKPCRAAPDTWVLPAYLPVPGTRPHHRQLVFDRESRTDSRRHGMPVVRQEFQETLWSLIEPKDLRWVFLTHDDGDHVGSLIEVLGAATNARLVTQFIGYARLETSFHMRPERMYLANPGQQVDLGDRTLGVLRPPVFDSPATSALFDGKSGVLFSADSFGAFIPELGEDVLDISPAAYSEGFEVFNRGNHPFSAWADKAKIDAVLAEIESLQPNVIASCHSPMARGNRIAPHLRQLSGLISMEPPLGPDQTAFEAILASMAHSPA